ncbi:phosphate ABC transporter permease PstA [Enterovirga sp.]|uniref:phosphate ABC transporter permease PstA n=1 Tax=Enterovirga sp. TaxID=2026350 RepID=UPI002B8BFBC1|nr:phosphate ABC transporter permease PstA [Enterovirga sp.]HMO29608.1 phosphate ABC transporter permease PstA [Enterovirga sp.]
MSEAVLSPARAAPAAWNRVRPSRRMADRTLKIVCVLFTGFGVFVLGWILLMLLVRGITALNLSTFTAPTPGPGTAGGGLANAMAGSLVLTFLGIAIATPIGILAGTYLSEYARTSKLAATIRFINDVLLSAPSILIGLFVYTLVVAPFGGYSGWAGGIALAIIAVPVIVRTTEDMLRLVPGSLREAAAALGAPTSRVVTLVTWRAAKAGIVTGLVLATARIAGETAPLLFTAFNNNFWFSPSLSGGISNLPVTIYQFALSPYGNWQELAWAGAFLITITILGLSILARFIIRKDKAR